MKKIIFIGLGQNGNEGAGGNAGYVHNIGWAHRTVYGNNGLDDPTHP